MGKRRMISKTVTQTHRFLCLPLEAQALYFHLIQNCDDDGVVEAFPIIRMIGASEDNLRLLEIRKFVRRLNDEMVYFVVDFHEQNTVRRDRYTPSIYKDLLEQSAENLITDSDDTTGKPLVNQATTTGKPLGNQTETNGKPNISQYNISQYNISQSRSIKKDEDEEKENKNPIFEKLKAAFGEMSVNGTMIAEVEDLLKIHGESLLLYALDVTILNAGKSIRYTRTILANWQGQGLRTVEQVKKHEEQRQNSKANNKTEGDTITSTLPEVPF